MYLGTKLHVVHHADTGPDVLRVKYRYDEAAEAYEEGLKTSPGDAALGRGLSDVLKAQEASKAPAGQSHVSKWNFNGFWVLDSPDVILLQK